mgnify:CR=1 FL=1
MMIADQKQVFRLLNLKSEGLSVAVLVVFTVASFLMGDWRIFFASLFVALFMARVEPDEKTYLVLGLSRGLWQQHRRRLIWGFALIFSSTSLVMGMIMEIHLVPVLAPLLIAFLRSLRNPRRASEKEQALKKPGTLRGIHLRVWRDIWISFASVTVCIWGWNEFQREEEKAGVAALAFVLFVLLGVFRGVNGTLRGTLRQWVAFGNTREGWLKQALLLSLLSPVAAIVFAPAYIYVFNGEFLHILIVGIFMPLIVLLADLADGKRILWIPLLGIGLGVFAGVLPSIYSVVVLVVGALFLVFLLWRMVLQVQIFRFGLAGWLGLARMVD